jgi:hypothetical protein
MTGCQVPGVRYLVPGAGYPVSGTRYLVPDTWIIDLRVVKIRRGLLEDVELYLTGHPAQIQITYQATTQATFQATSQALYRLRVTGCRKWRGCGIVREKIREENKGFPMPLGRLLHRSDE